MKRRDAYHRLSLSCVPQARHSEQVFCPVRFGRGRELQCGESSLTIDAEENKFRLCAVRRVRRRAHCGCSAEKLLHGRGIGLACPETKMLCCFIGEGVCRGA